MQRPAMDNDGVLARNIKICQVGSEEEIVWFDIRTQQQRALSPKPERHFREMPCAFEEHSLLAHPGACNVAQAVEHRKHRAILQNPGTVVGRRGFGRYVVLLGDVNFIQVRTPSSTLSGGFLWVTGRWVTMRS